MGLFDQIFRPTKAKEAQKALQEAHTYFKTLTAYKPTFTTWGGEIYERAYFFVGKSGGY